MSERIKHADIHSQATLKPIVIVRNGYNVKLSFSTTENIDVIETVKEILTGTYKTAIYQALNRE